MAAHRRPAGPSGRRRDTARFLRRELHRPGAGSPPRWTPTPTGVEGLTYAWTPAQLVEALGEDDGRWAADLFDVTDAGTFEHGTSVLGWPGTSTTPTRRSGTAGRACVGRLLAARDTRPQPARDDKVVAAWNGLAITALVEFLQVAAFQVAPDDGTPT